MKPEPLEISRLFDAQRERVFAAWSTSDRVARWFSPEHCSVPKAEVDFRAGGVFALADVFERSAISSFETPESAHSARSMIIGNTVRTAASFMQIGPRIF